jgi:hypothetical protein
MELVETYHKYENEGKTDILHLVTLPKKEDKKLRRWQEEGRRDRDCIKLRKEE